MNRYYQTDQLQKMIDWNNIMKMSRYAGGHDDQMRGLFKDAEIIGHWNEGDWQGMVATCVILSDGKYVIYNDYYGSCSGCDSWEDSTDDDVRKMCIDLANSSYVFENVNDVVLFLHTPDKDGYSWKGKSSVGLLGEIMKNRQVLREITIDTIVK